MIPPNIQGKRDVGTLVINGAEFEFTQVVDRRLEIIAFNLAPIKPTVVITPEIQAGITAALTRMKGHYEIGRAHV